MKLNISHSLLFLISIIFLNCSHSIVLKNINENYKIIFITPKEADQIPSRGMSTTTIECKGKVVGHIILGMKIKIDILTDKWYPQGSAFVGSDGEWEINPIYLGGEDHIIKADLINSEGKLISSNSIMITRIE